MSSKDRREVSLTDDFPKKFEAEDFSGEVKRFRVSARNISVGGIIVSAK